MMAGNEATPPGTGVALDEQQRGVVSAEAPGTQLQTYEPRSADQTKSQQEPNSQRARQAVSAGSQDLGNPMS